MKTDIQSKEDLLKIVTDFYNKMLEDEVLSYIFKEVMPVHLETHLPDLALFWEQILFGENGYRKNVMQMHVKLNQLEPLKNEHFDRWLLLFNEAVDKNHQGNKSSEMKNRARDIAGVMKFKCKWGKPLS